MNQRTYDFEFDAIVAGLGPVPARLGQPGSTGERDIQRIASAVFCSSGIDPSIVSFAVHRTAVHWGLAEDEIDVGVSVAVLANAARVMHEISPVDARQKNLRPVGGLGCRPGGSPVHPAGDTAQCPISPAVA